MISRIAFLLLFLPGVTLGQGLTEPKQKAINNYVQLANHLTGELQSLGPSLVRYNLVSIELKKYPTRPVPQYLCKLDSKTYYYEEAVKSAPSLGGAGAALSLKVEALRESYSKIDATCKTIEIYFRLKDYESDSFKKFEEQLTLIQTQVVDYSNKLKAFQAEVEKLTNVLQPHNESLPYHRANKLMRSQLAFERELLDSWSFNVMESVHTGWPVENAQKHIVDDMPKIEKLKSTSIVLQYPASSMMKSFIESIEDLQRTKRSAVDGYTFEQQQSDKHSNDSYYNLINYYNNAAISFNNNFISQANQNGYRGIYYVNFVPLFQVRKEAKKISIEVTPFVDKTVTELKVTPVATPVTSSVFKSLSNSVDFINDGVRQFDNMMSSMRNLNGSASYGKASLIEEKRVFIDYYYKRFELPVTGYQQTVVQSKLLPAAYQKPLLAQAEVLYSILTELNQWNNLLLAEAASKQLARDSLNHVYSVIARYKELAETFDVRKERLYKDVRKIFESYKPANAKSSWLISGKGLLAIMDEDRKVMLATRQRLTVDSTIQINTNEIQKMSRELITNEYANLTGIEKLGRYNGNCPYTPYEYMATYSKSFAENIDEIDKAMESDYNRHPYNELVHTYNQSLVYNYNKFTELSKVPLLKTVTQLQLFEIIPPKKPAPKKVVEPVLPSVVEVYTPEIVEPEVAPVVAVSASKSEKQKRKKKDEKPVVSDQPVSGGVVHDTVRITDIIRIETVRQDTVFVSKVDTVFVGIPGEMNMSMEGYATNNMVLLLDVSGSMNTPEKLPLLKKSVLLLLKMMRPEDEVSIVVFSGKAKVALQPISFKEEEKIKKVIEQLRSEGQTDGNAGIELAYDVADKNYIRGGNNRIILATDGEFPVNEKTFNLVKKFSGEDIFMTIFNFGKTTLSAKNLKQLSAFGKGNYEYVSRENVDVKLIGEAKAKKRK
jgi:Mg-chelatase subunit ChlD